MIAQELKPISEILDQLEGKQKIVLVGCGGCAEFYGVGGKDDLREMAEQLESKGKEVLANIEFETGEYACNASWSKKHLRNYIAEIKKADALLVMACGDGLQTVRALLDERFEVVKPIYPATNGLGLMGGGPEEFEEECRLCGECVLGRFAGICPITHCPKGLLNGPCGGASKEGKCEVDSDRDCAWLQIYHRLQKLEQLGTLEQFTGFKDWSKSEGPRKFNRATE